MNLRFKCPTKGCMAEQWLIDFDTETKKHKITCIKCGGTTIIEDLFSKRKGGENVKSKPNVSISKQSGINKTEGNTGKVWSSQRSGAEATIKPTSNQYSSSQEKTISKDTISVPKS